GDRLAPPDLDVAGREEQRLRVELVRTHRGRHAGPGARLREDHRQGLPGERRGAVAAGLHTAREVEQPQDLVPGEVGDGEEVALGGGHGIPGRRVKMTGDGCQLYEPREAGTGGRA